MVIYREMHKEILSLFASNGFNSAALAVTDALAFSLMVLIYFSNPKGTLNKRFVLLSLSLLLWVNGGYFFSLLKDAQIALVVGRIILSEVALSFIVLYFFILHFPSRMKSSVFVNYFQIAMGIVISVITISSSFVVEGVYFTDFGAEPEYGPGATIYYAIIALQMFLLVRLIYKRYRNTLAGDESGARYLLIGFALFISWNLIFNVYFPLFRDSIQYWQLGNYSSIFFLILSGYAIVQHPSWLFGGD